jgi:hypothetical protein
MIAVFDSVEGYQDNKIFVLFDNGEVDSFSSTNCLIPGRPWEITRIWRVASTLEVRCNKSVSGRHSTDRHNTSVSSYILWLHNRPRHGMSWGYNDEGTLKKYQWFFKAISRHDHTPAHTNYGHHQRPKEMKAIFVDPWPEQLPWLISWRK